MAECWSAGVVARQASRGGAGFDKTRVLSMAKRGSGGPGGGSERRKAIRAEDVEGELWTGVASIRHVSYGKFGTEAAGPPGGVDKTIVLSISSGRKLLRKRMVDGDGGEEWEI